MAADRNLRGLPLSIFAILGPACSSPNEVVQPWQGYVPTTTGQVFVRSAGRGPDVVLLHGLGDSGVGWRKIKTPLREAGYRVIIPDALGAGRSFANSDADLSVPAHMQRLEQLLANLEIERPILVGNSLGGSVALLFAQKFPDRVRALVLVNPAAYRTGTQDGRWIWALPDVTEAAMKLMGPNLIAQIGLRFNYADWSRITGEDIAVYTDEAARPGAIESFLHQQQQVERDMREAEGWEQGHGSITCSTLILWGDGDPILPIAQAHRLVEDIPDSRLVILEGVGHVSQLEAPDRVLEEIVRFLREMNR